MERFNCAALIEHSAPFLKNMCHIASRKEITDIQMWRHIRSKDNLADALSRGQLLNAFLIKSGLRDRHG